MCSIVHSAVIPVAQMVVAEITYCRAYTAVVNLPGWSKLLIWRFITTNEHYGEDNVSAQNTFCAVLLPNQCCIFHSVLVNYPGIQHRYFIQILYSIKDVQDPLSTFGLMAFLLFISLVRFHYGNKIAILPEAFSPAPRFNESLSFSK